jgi:hypothetical protein
MKMRKSFFTAMIIAVALATSSVWVHAQTAATDTPGAGQNNTIILGDTPATTKAKAKPPAVKVTPTPAPAPATSGTPQIVQYRTRDGKIYLGIQMVVNVPANAPQATTDNKDAEARIAEANAATARANADTAQAAAALKVLEANAAAAQAKPSAAEQPNDEATTTDGQTTSDQPSSKKHWWQGSEKQTASCAPPKPPDFCSFSKEKLTLGQRQVCAEETLAQAEKKNANWTAVGALGIWAGDGIQIGALVSGAYTANAAAAASASSVSMAKLPGFAAL